MTSIIRILLSGLLLVSMSSHAEIIERQYEGFKVWVDCELRGHIMYDYTIGKDTANLKRKSNFRIDKEVPARCQQKSSSTYRINGKSVFDRGHSASYNHLENSKLAASQSDYMTNIWPQHRVLNRGAMYQSEVIAECYREIEPLRIIGGPVTSIPPVNSDYFVSHGIHTPGAFWKILIRNNRAIAWVMPNTSEATKNKLDDYIVSVRYLEKLIGMQLPVPEHIKDLKPHQSWYIPKGCDLS